MSRTPGFMHGIALFFLAAGALSAQKTTNFTYTITITGESKSAGAQALGAGFGTLASVGPVAMNLDVTQPTDPSNGNPLDDYKGTISFVFNRLDSFDVAVTIPNGNGNPPALNGNITGGKGAYQGATGQVAFTISGLPAPAPRSMALRTMGYQLAATGNLTVGGKATALNLPNIAMASFGSRNLFTDTNTGTADVSPFGSGTLTIVGAGGDNNTRQAASVTIKFNANDSVSFFISFLGDNPPPNTPGQIIGGSGAYAGATGSLVIANVSAAPDGNSVSITGSGAITTGATGIPVITDVSTAFGNREIAPNTWTAVKGNNLVPSNTPAAGVNWNDAPEFNSGQMPTNLHGISVTVNGIPAYVSFYCSAATNKDCATDQINILTPLDTIGDITPAGVVVTNGSVSSPAFVVNEVSLVEPSFLLFSTKGHVLGVHLDASLLGPTTLYPGLSTPAKAGETVLLFAVGYGVPKGGATQGSATQSGAVQGTVNCSVAGKIVQNVPVNIISPGLAQFNLTLPAGLPSGDDLIFCGGGFGGGISGRTPAGNLIAIQ